MKLQAEYGQLFVLDCSVWTGAGFSDGDERFTDARNLIAVAHPNVHLARKSGKESRVIVDFAGRRPVFSTWSVVDFATESFTS